MGQLDAVWIAFERSPNDAFDKSLLRRNVPSNVVSMTLGRPVLHVSIFTCHQWVFRQVPHECKFVRDIGMADLADMDLVAPNAVGVLAVLEASWGGERTCGVSAWSIPKVDHCGIVVS